LPGDEHLLSLTSVEYICHHLLIYVKGTNFFPVKNQTVKRTAFFHLGTKCFPCQSK